MNRIDLFDEAAEILNGRSNQHGPPENTFGRIARYWSLYLEEESKLYEELSATDISEMMNLLKLARSQDGDYNRDDFRDRINYTKFANDFREQGHE